MDPTSFGFLLLVVLIGGFVAWVADRLGRKLGKKRLSFMGLRPRHTAELFTVGAGILIPLITILIVMGASSDVRTWLTEGRQALQDRTRLLKDVDDLRKQQAEIKQTNSGLLASNAHLEGTNKTLSKQVDDQKDTLRDLRSQITQMQSKVAAAQARAAAASARAGTYLTRVASLDSKLAQTSRAIKSAELNLRNRKKEYDALNASYSYVFKERDDLLKHEKQLDQELDDKTKQIAAAAKTIQDLKEEQARLQNEREAAAGDLVRVQNDLADKKRMLDEMTGIFSANFVSARLKPLIFDFGQEVTRIRVAAAQSKAETRKILGSAIDFAKRAAKDRGAGVDQQIQYAGLMPQNSTSQPLSVDAQLDLIASELAGNPEEQLLIVLSRYNVFKDEGAIIFFRHEPNPIVYKAGQPISELRIDGREQKKAILASLDALAAKVQAQAVKDKMIPIQGSDSSIGTITSDQILDIYERIKTENRIVRVVAAAKEETRAGDPLQLNFLIKY